MASRSSQVMGNLMRNFFLFCLALALVLVGEMAKSYESLPTRPENEIVERVANTTSGASTDSDDVEEDDISLKISSLQSDELILSIPKKQTDANTSLDFEVYLTNHRSTVASVNLGDIPIPELINSDGKKLKPQGEDSKNQQSKPEEFGGYDCAFLDPDAPNSRNYFGFRLKTKLSWNNDLLRLEISDRFSNLWFFDALKPETYQLRFSYDIPDGTTSCYDPSTMGLRTIQGIQPGRGVTQWLKLRLIETTATDSNAIEVDGIRFKIEMPKSVLTIPANQPGATTPVKLGVRITNNTSTLVYFRRMGSIYPTLIRKDGQAVDRDTDTFRLSSPTFYSAQPGKSVLFILDGTLSWKDNKLQLAIPNQSNGFWYFRGLSPKEYQFQFIYQGTTGARETELRLPLPRNLWRGWIAMPPVEFRLVKP